MLVAALQAEWPRAIEELTSFPHIEEAAILSTCNRMELYVVALSWHRVRAAPRRQVLVSDSTRTCGATPTAARADPPALTVRCRRASCWQQGAAACAAGTGGAAAWSECCAAGKAWWWLAARGPRWAC